MPDPWSPIDEELRSIISKSLDTDLLFEEARKIFSDQTAPAFLNVLYELQDSIGAMGLKNDSFDEMVYGFECGVEEE